MIVGNFVASLISTTYLYYSFVDHLTIYSRHIVEEKREHFTEKRLDKGPRRRGALIIISALIQNVVHLNFGPRIIFHRDF